MKRRHAEITWQTRNKENNIHQQVWPETKEHTNNNPKPTSTTNQQTLHTTTNYGKSETDQNKTA